MSIRNHKKTACRLGYQENVQSTDGYTSYISKEAKINDSRVEMVMQVMVYSYLFISMLRHVPIFLSSW